MNRPVWFRFSALALGAALLAVSATAVAKKTVEEERSEVRQASREALARLYAAQPAAKSAVAAGAGYATFSNFGLKIGVAGGGRGKGLAVVKGGREVFMRFVEVQAGLGLGIKKYDLIFVFDSKAALDSFIDKGWEAGGQATAAASTGAKGKAYQGALSVSEGVWLYQLTSKGLAAELTVKGTKYYQDKDLN
jgi:lipid-binding SYLF domain-containing protein